MKKIVIGLLCGILLLATAGMALASGDGGYGCFPQINYGPSSSDAKYFQEQSASGAVGVTNSCVSEQAVYVKHTEAVSVEGVAFGALDKVGCAGVLGIGKLVANAEKSETCTVGSYNIHQVSTTLAGTADMQQLGGVAATQSGFGAASQANICQTQNFNYHAAAALPGGFAVMNYNGSQFAQSSAK